MAQDTDLQKAQNKLSEAYNQYYQQVSDSDLDEGAREKVREKTIAPAHLEMDRVVEQAIDKVYKKYNIKQANEQDPAIREVLMNPDPILAEDEKEAPVRVEIGSSYPTKSADIAGSKEKKFNSNKKGQDAPNPVPDQDFPSEIHYERTAKVYEPGSERPSLEFFGFGEAADQEEKNTVETVAAPPAPKRKPARIEKPTLKKAKKSGHLGQKLHKFNPKPKKS